MRGHWIGGTRKLNKHWQSEGGGTPLPPFVNAGHIFNVAVPLGGTLRGIYFGVDANKNYLSVGVKDYGPNIFTNIDDIYPIAFFPDYVLSVNGSTLNTSDIINRFPVNIIKCRRDTLTYEWTKEGIDYTRSVSGTLIYINLSDYSQIPNAYEDVPFNSIHPRQYTTQYNGNDLNHIEIHKIYDYMNDLNQILHYDVYTKALFSAGVDSYFKFSYDGSTMFPYDNHKAISVDHNMKCYTTFVNQYGYEYLSTELMQADMHFNPVTITPNTIKDFGNVDNITKMKLKIANSEINAISVHGNAFLYFLGFGYNGVIQDETLSNYTVDKRGGTL